MKNTDKPLNLHNKMHTGPQCVSQPKMKHYLESVSDDFSEVYAFFSLAVGSQSTNFGTHKSLVGMHKHGTLYDSLGCSNIFLNRETI